MCNKTIKLSFYAKLLVTLKQSAICRVEQHSMEKPISVARSYPDTPPRLIRISPILVPFACRIEINSVTLHALYISLFLFVYKLAIVPFHPALHHFNESQAYHHFFFVMQFKHFSFILLYAVLCK